MKQGSCSHLAQKARKKRLAGGGKVQESELLIREIDKTHPKEVVLIGVCICYQRAPEVFTDQIWTTEAMSEVQARRVLQKLLEVEVSEVLEGGLAE